MKILIINSRYFLSAGPEKYMFGLKQILEQHGHIVIFFSTKNSKNEKTQYENYFVDPIGGKDKVYFKDYKKNLKTLLQLIGRQFYSFEVKRKLDKLIKDTNPDIAYVLHHYNKLSPSIVDACKNNQIPIVMRLSDFFLVCPEGHLYRDKKPCEECIHKSLYSAIRHKCVKNSFFASFVKVAAMKFHRIIKIYNKINYIISPSTFTIDKVKSKLSKAKITHLPTFILNTEKYNPKIGNYILFVGRLEEIKGIILAIDAVKNTKYKLKIVGDSSTFYDTQLKAYVHQNKIKNVEFLGQKKGNELTKLYKESRFVILPVLCYENLPNVALEAMMNSKPLLVSNIGSMKSLVYEGYNGLLFEPGNVDQLKKKIKILFEDQTLCVKLGKNAYNEAITKYNPENHYEKLIKIFEKSIEESKK